MAFGALFHGHRWPIFLQHDRMDCGPTCLRMVARYHGKNVALRRVRELCHISRTGISLKAMADAASQLGLRTLAARLNWEKLAQAPLPAVAHWKQAHYVVVYEVRGEQVRIADPAHGMVTYSREEFCKHWVSSSQEGVPQGIVLLLEPTADFHQIEGEEEPRQSHLLYLLSYLKQHRGLVLQLVLGLLVAGGLGLLSPLLMQALVDVGIQQADLTFVSVVLAAQFALYLGRTVVELVRSWLVLHIGARINVAILSDFLFKLMRLPMRFFESRQVGDILQRIGDHTRVEQFLTSSTLYVVFSAILFLVYGTLLASYSPWIFALFSLGCALTVAWLVLFLRARRSLDFKRFAQLADNQTTLIQLIDGMQEIKIAGCDLEKRGEWESIQARIFHINVRSLALAQYQELGAAFLLETKDIALTLLVAREVAQGRMSLGMMLALQYMLGQMNLPLRQLPAFLQSYQGATIGVERLREIHAYEDEEDPLVDRIQEVPLRASIRVKGLSFHYGGPSSPKILDDLSLEIPHGKTTAIVGSSGSGKTTLLKLLLGFHAPTDGVIEVGGCNLASLSLRAWRGACGVVLQGGFLFSDTIARNIALGEELIDQERLVWAAELANIRSFIEQLPLGYGTRVGADGSGLSEGQKQRILIARALYKRPSYLFFDEATSALDASNERVITERFSSFTEGKTVLVVAHRLSTVRKADQIIVLERGRIAERGTHDELIQNRGPYFSLVKNQLELGA
jgi:ATP-binding cassette subfamily B protein